MTKLVISNKAKLDSARMILHKKIDDFKFVYS